MFNDVVKNWLRSRETIEFLGLWESLHNPGFKQVEFDLFRSQAGLNAFTMSPTKWIEGVNAIGIVSKAGRYGGTYAHSDIAFEFASWISVEFKLYVIKDCKRLKSDENSRLSLGWNLNREIAKLNYRIHTDAIKDNLIPPELARRKYGSNDLTNQKQDTIFHCIRRAFVNPFSVVLFFLGVISLFADVLLVEGHRSNATSVIIIFSMLFISGIVRLTQELKAKKISDELTTLVQSSVSVLRDGKWTEIPSDEIVVGDQVSLTAGDRVPADMRMTEGSDLFVSQSVITGESTILEKTAEPLIEEPKDFSDYTNILFGGTTVTGGYGKGIVLAVGAETVYGGLSIQTHRKNNGFDRGANQVAWIMIRFMAVLQQRRNNEHVH